MTKINLFKRIAALAIAGISAFTVMSCEKKLSPMETIEEAIDVNIDKLSESESVSKIEKFYNGGSIEIKGNLSKIIELVAGTPMDLDASLKMYADMDAKIPAAAVVAAVGLDGTTLADLLTYSNGKSVAIKSDTLLGDTAYGITYETVKEKFENSIFGPNGEYSLGDSEEIEAMVAYFDALSSASASGTETMKNLEDACEKFSNELKPTIYKSVETNGNAQIAEGKVTIAGTEVVTNNVVMNFDIEGIFAYTKDALSALKDSKHLKSVIEATYAYYDETQKFSTDITTATFADVTGYTADEAYTEIIALIDEALTSLEEIDLTEEGVPEVNLSIVTSISKKTGELLSVSAELTSDGVTGMDFDLVLATSYSPAWGLYIEAVESEIAIVYDVTDTDALFESALNVTLDGSTFEFFSLKWDKTTGEYAIALTDPIYGEVIAALGGTYFADKNSVTLTLSDIYADGETIDIGEFTVIVTYEDKMPTIDSFTEILDLTSADIQTIGMKLLTGINSLAYLFS